MVSRSHVFVWTPDRNAKRSRVRRIDTVEGSTGVTLFPGAISDSSGLVVWLSKGELSDFLYDPGLRLIVSDSVRDVVRRYPASVQFLPAELRVDPNQGESGYWWINPLVTSRLLDEHRSRYKMLIPGVFSEIEHFEIQVSNLPDEDVFICGEIGLPVFSERLTKDLREADLTGGIFTPLQGARWPIRSNGT